MAIEGDALTNLDDATLVEMALTQTAGAYDILMRRYHNMLTQMLSRRGVTNIADIIQDSFVKAYLNLEKFNPQYPFGAWITTIARNLHVDHTRRQKTSPSLSLEDVNTPDGAPTPEQSIIKSQNLAQLELTISKLPMNYQTILRLRFWDDLSYEEIADTLEMPLGTVKTQIHRARTQLLKSIDEQKSK